VRFVRSKKARIYWNNRNITHLFSEGNRRLEKVSFAWQARSGEIFQVTAQSDQNAPKGENQFGFSIDGHRFEALPRMDQLGEEQDAPVRREKRCPPEAIHPEDAESILSLSSHGENDSGGNAEHEKEQIGEHPEPADLGFRLSMVGLSPGHGDEVVDELRSDLYSSTIDLLRNRITKCIPQTEEMVSRAVINAFFSDDESHSTNDSVSESFSDHTFYHAVQFEADAMRAAYVWVKQNQPSFVDVNDELVMEFLQKQVDAVLLQVRRDRLSAIEACQVLISVACVLGLDVTAPGENTTVVLLGLDKATTEEDLASVMKKCGEINSAAVSSLGGLGRFTLGLNKCLNHSVASDCALTGFLLAASPQGYAAMFIRHRLDLLLKPPNERH
jgi:hypothetical protein